MLTTKQRTLTSFGGLGLSVLGASVSAQQLPAVDNTNAKLSFGFEGSEDSNGGFVEGSLSVPLGQSLGAQFDLGAYNRTGDGVGNSAGAGVHLFYRDPSSFLVGVYGHVIETDTDAGTVSASRLGVEAEFYLNDLTLAMFVGQDRLDGDGLDKTYDSLDFTGEYYLTPNTQVYAGFSQAFDEELGNIGVNHLVDAGGLPVGLFADVSSKAGEQTYTLGATVYFGSNGKSLKDIHRKSDPRIRLGIGPSYLDTLKDFVKDSETPDPIPEVMTVEEMPKLLKPLPKYL